MQSGISASQELLDAFNTLVSDSQQRGLLATISSETLVPGATIPSQSSTFTSDLEALQPLLSTTAATYVLLKTHADAPDGFVAITYVPDAAPVRQKMLFASTRLTLVRELGVERFRETIFVTTKAELTAEGWERHVKHVSKEAPLTEEEESLKGIKEAEVQESRGTAGRNLSGGGRLAMATGDGVTEALEALKSGEGGGLVVLKIDTTSETILLDTQASSISPADMSSHISSTEPRYTFYKYPATGSVIFIYTCPSSSKIREKMIYASSRMAVVKIAETNTAIEVAKRLEGSSPEEFSAQVLEQEFEEKKVESKGFAKPKRPGRK